VRHCGYRIAIMRNPPWTRDELILALDTYFKISPRAPTPAKTEIQELSSFLNKMGRKVSVKGGNFRTPASVVMKLMNFRSIDPHYSGVGLTASSRADRELWKDFAEDRERLGKVARIIWKSDQLEQNENLMDDLEITEAEEGRILTRLHILKERNRKIVERRKKITLKQKGFLACEVCGFDFKNIYGKRGIGFIECHHKKPLHTLEIGSKTRLEDLALLCSNCHRMIHARRPWLSLEELSQLVTSEKKVNFC